MIKSYIAAEIVNLSRAHLHWAFSIRSQIGTNGM